MLNIFITNLGKYNEGELIGEWVELPISEEDLEKVFERIEINERYEEFFITDYETDIPDFKVGEFDSVDELNELTETLENLDGSDKEVVYALLSESYDIQEAIEKKDDCYIYWNCEDMTDVAYEVVEQCGYLHNVPETIARYFDYEAFGRDLRIEGNFVFTANGNCIQIF